MMMKLMLERNSVQKMNMMMIQESLNISVEGKLQKIEVNDKETSKIRMKPPPTVNDNKTPILIKMKTKMSMMLIMNIWKIETETDLEDNKEVNR